MTSSAKSSLTINTSLLTDGQGADAADVSVPLGELLTLLKSGGVSITANDTHVKHLNDALTVGTGMAKAVGSAGGNETLALTLDSKLAALVALLTAAGKVPAGGMDSTGAANGTVPTANGSGGVSWASPGGGGAQPVDITVTAGEALALRDYVYLASDGKAYKVDIDASPVRCGRIRGIVTAGSGIAQNSTGTVRILGEVSGFAGLTAWADVWADATAGALTQTKPTVLAGGAQKAVARVGFATSATNVMVMPGDVEFLKRVSLADQATTTIEHHADAAGRSRKPGAFVSSASSGASLTSYASSNQDSNVELRYRVPATYAADATGSGTASASSTLSPNVAANVFDNNTSTYWASNNVTTGWLKFDFGAGVTKVIRQFNMTAQGSTFFNRSPRTFTFEGSNDDSTWTVLYTASNETGWTASQTRTYTFANETPYRYYRLNVTAVDGGTLITLVEMELKEAATYTDGANKLAQSFQLGSLQVVDSAELWLKKVGDPAGTMTLRIETDSGGSPSGTLAHSNATATINEASVLSTYGSVLFDFVDTFSLAGSTTYWLVLSTSRSQSQTDYIVWGADASSPGYASGEMKNEKASVWSAESKDAVFDLRGAGTSYDEPCVVGRWSGGSRDVAVRFDDGSNNNPDTRTTFKNTSGGTLDVTCVVRLE